MDPIHATSEEISIDPMVQPGVAADPPKSCLLASKPLVGESTNATTAICHIEDPDNLFSGISVRVSLFVASPPLVSYVLAWSHDHDFSDDDFIQEPLIRSTHGGLILLTMAILPKRCLFPDYYVYRPGGCGHGGANVPSLELVPLPEPMDMRVIGEPCAVGLLSHGGGGSEGYYVAVLTRQGTGEFELCIFCSETGTWTNKKPLFLLEENGGAADFRPGKVITVGSGGVLAFVDLCNGILIGDVLQGRPEFHYIPLPDFYQPWTNSWLPPRDVSIDMSGGNTLRIKVIDVVSPLILGAWVSATWVTTTTATSPWFQLEDWDTDSTLEARQLSVGDGVSIAELLPETLELDVKPNFGLLFLDMPMLSLHEDNIVCFLARQHSLDVQVWVIVVDMVKKKLLGVHPLKMGRFPTLFYSTISSYLNMTAAASGTN